MPITEYLERNADLYGDEVALVELNPEQQETARITWKEFELIQPTKTQAYRRQITWKVFDEKANRLANMLLSRGIKKGNKIGILMMNCLEWLPIYFGILKTGALAVPLNFRYTSDEILYCSNLAELDILFFGPTADRHIFHIHIVLLEHTFLQVFSPYVVGGIGAAIVVAVVDFNRDGAGFGEFAIHKAVIGHVRESHGREHSQQQCQGQHQGQDAFHRFFLLYISRVLLPRITS